MVLTLLFSKVLKLNETTVLVCGGATWPAHWRPREWLKDCEFYTYGDTTTHAGPELAPGTGKRLGLVAYANHADQFPCGD